MPSKAATVGVSALSVGIGLVLLSFLLTQSILTAYGDLRFDYYGRQTDGSYGDPDTTGPCEGDVRDLAKCNQLRAAESLTIPGWLLLAIGAILVVGVLAGLIPAGAPRSAAPTLGDGSARFCLACGSKLGGPYCSNCGVASPHWKDPDQ